MNIDLSGKNAFVGGSTQGLGKATALELASLGASVTLIARRESALKEVCESLDTSHGQTHDYLVADFSQPEELRSVVDNYLNSHKKNIHILINNSGGPAGGPIIEADIEDFFNAYRMHLVCNHILTQAVVPGMKEAGYGRIINIISTSVKVPIKGLGVSNTTRGAVASWAKTLANELGAFGITVNNLLPGMTETERLRSLITSWAKQRGISEDEMKEILYGTVPAGRFAQPEEIGQVIAFLASSAASYVNGINLPVDGGRTGTL